MNVTCACGYVACVTTRLSPYKQPLRTFQFIILTPVLWTHFLILFRDVLDQTEEFASQQALVAVFGVNFIGYTGLVLDEKCRQVAGDFDDSSSSDA